MSRVYCYVRYEVSDERRRHDSGHGSDTVDHGHRGPRIIRTQIHYVHFHTRIEKAHRSHTDGEQRDHLYLIAAGVRRCQCAQHGTDTS